MSRLHYRVRELERRAGRCPTCAKRPALIEIVTPSGSRISGTDADTSPCADCGQAREHLRIHFAFELYDEDDPQPQPGAPADPTS